MAGDHLNTTSPFVYFTELFDILTMEEESAVAVVQLNKSDCTLDRRNLRDGTAEVWK